MDRYLWVIVYRLGDYESTHFSLHLLGLLLLDPSILGFQVQILIIFQFPLNIFISYFLKVINSSNILLEYFSFWVKPMNTRDCRIELRRKNHHQNWRYSSVRALISLRFLFYSALVFCLLFLILIFFKYSSISPLHPCYMAYTI